MCQRPQTSSSSAVRQSSPTPRSSPSHPNRGFSKFRGRYSPNCCPSPSPGWRVFSSNEFHRCSCKYHRPRCACSSCKLHRKTILFKALRSCAFAETSWPTPPVDPPGAPPPQPVRRRVVEDRSAGAVPHDGYHHSITLRDHGQHFSRMLRSRRIWRLMRQRPQHNQVPCVSATLSFMRMRTAPRHRRPQAEQHWVRFATLPNSDPTAADFAPILTNI